MKSGRSDIKIKPVRTKAEIKAFIRMPDRLYANDPNWVRPLMAERLALLDRTKNPFFQHAEACYWMAYRGEKPVGRISAQIDHSHEKSVGERVGHFGMFECVNDETVARSLFDKAEHWLKEKGCSCIRGPFNLSTNGECGLLVDGFQTPPVLMMGHGLPYYPEILKNMGYRKAKDLLAYELDLLRPLPPRIARFVSSAERSGNYVLRNIDMNNYDQELRTIIDIFNDAWSENWGFVPLTEDEAKHLAKEIRPIVSPHRVRICDFKGEPVAMFVTLPDVNAAIKEVNGKLLPFGWWTMIRRLFLSYPRRMRTPLMGVRKSLQKTRHSAAISLLMIEKTRQEVVQRGANWAELSWILEDNHGMRNILSEIGCEIYKTYRIYEKEPVSAQS